MKSVIVVSSATSSNHHHHRCSSPLTASASACSRCSGSLDRLLCPRIYDAFFARICRNPSAVVLIAEQHSAVIVILLLILLEYFRIGADGTAPYCRANRIVEAQRPPRAFRSAWIAQCAHCVSRQILIGALVFGTLYYIVKFVVDVSTMVMEYSMLDLGELGFFLGGVVSAAAFVGLSSLTRRWATIRPEAFSQYLVNRLLADPVVKSR
jgi:hypothetical protein